MSRVILLDQKNLARDSFGERCASGSLKMLKLKAQYRRCDIKTIEPFYIPSYIQQSKRKKLSFLSVLPRRT